MDLMEVSGMLVIVIWAVVIAIWAVVIVILLPTVMEGGDKDGDEGDLVRSGVGVDGARGFGRDSVEAVKADRQWDVEYLCGLAIIYDVIIMTSVCQWFWRKESRFVQTEPFSVNRVGDITLTPKDRRTKAFANETHHAIQKQLNVFVTESPRLNEYVEMPLVRAVAKYRNGDIRLTFHSAWAASLLTSEADHWLPVFSSLLQLRAPTFPVVMHRVSTSFELGTGLPNGDDNSERDNNIVELVDANKMRSWDVARVQWISRRPVDELRTAKRHSS
ncbi:hypothetical protein B0H14DRAFT_3661284 [Mycena olivaceomarginata]|nr:hypothetical protein B0H14DRAFT_3661284 [Mycena olivaceomarginata]